MKYVSAVFFATIVGCAVVQLVPAANAVSFKEKVLYSFNGTDGENPNASPINVNGVLYGTTRQGGTGSEGGGGTVFSFDPNTGVEAVLYSFCSQGYCDDGALPDGSLTDVNGTLYGTTATGGANCHVVGCGTVFSIDPNTGTETVLYSFCTQQNCTDGDNPQDTLVNVNGTLYGTTYYGGTYDYGTVFSIDPNTGTETVLYSFCSQDSCTDGRNPVAGLIDVNGKLYGTTTQGGSHGGGIVFSVNPKTGAEKVLYSFCSQSNCTDGGNPHAGVINVKGTIYGTTSLGGATCQDSSYGCGIVFALDPRTGAETVLHSFLGGADGATPSNGLIYQKGMLYGTTVAGGVADCNGNGCGTVFSLDPSTNIETVLYSFCSHKNCADGATPEAGLLASNDKLYGTTSEGGVQSCYSGCGTAFELKKKP